MLRPSGCWPELRLIGCWLGGSVGVKARKLKDHYGEVSLRDLGYMASEGHFPVRDAQFKWKILCLEASADDRQAIVRTVHPSST